MSSSRNLKALAVLASLAGLCACGFTPLYGDNSSDANVERQMDEVSVGIIPDRPGQLLRQALQDQLQLAGAPTQQSYELSVSDLVIAQATGIQEDTSATRIRYTASASWVLAPIGNPQKPLAKGLASTENALNIIDQQYFQITLETNTVNQQLANEIAAQISAQVAAYFKTHPGAG